MHYKVCISTLILFFIQIYLFSLNNIVLKLQFNIVLFCFHLFAWLVHSVPWKIAGRNKALLYKKDSRRQLFSSSWFLYWQKYAALRIVICILVAILVSYLFVTWVLLSITIFSVLHRWLSSVRFSNIFFCCQLKLDHFSYFTTVRNIILKNKIIRL